MFLVIFALLLLSAIAAMLIYSTQTETGVNYNYRQEEISYFGARAGVEEARDRMPLSQASGGLTCNSTTPANNCLPAPGTPATPAPALWLPPDNGGAVIYITNPGSGSTISPTTPGASNPYFDDEFCHDYPAYSGSTSAGVRCTTYPSGLTVDSTTYASSSAWNLWAGTGATLSYKWSRISVKENASAQYGAPAAGGSPGSPSSTCVNTNYYCVDPTQPANQPVCYDGNSERVLPAGYADCAAWAGASTPVYANPVYLVTSMAVAPSGARKVVQMDLGLAPAQPLPYGLFGTGTGCGVVTFSGNAYTDSYNSANGPYNKSTAGSHGDVGSFGNITLSGNATFNGAVGVSGTPPYSASIGACPGNGVTESGNAGFTQNAQGCPTNQKCPTPLPNGLTFTAPPAPNPPPPTTNQTYSKSVTLPSGTYGNISMSGKATLTLSPGVYNINSLTMSGQSSLCVNPVGQVVLNIAGQGGTALTLSGQSVADAAACGGSSTQSLPVDFQVNYAGTGTITLSGQAASYLVVNAPNTAVTVSGQGDTFGAILGKTITYSGQGNFHYDQNAAFRTASNPVYSVLGFREVSY
jgi:hypothetical protein